MLRTSLLPLAIGVLALPLAAATVPAGFTDVSLFDLGSPTALAFTPDGRMLVATQGGELRVYKNGALLATPALTLGAGTVCSTSERGLLGVAVDPEFAANQYVYLYYTYHVPSSSACVNRASRFTFGTGADTINPASELVLVDNMPSPAGNHNAGDVHFGRDGYLYISIGDGGCDWAGNSGCGGTNDASRDQHVLTGKILRVTKTGGIPPTNPFQGAGTARCNVTGQTTAGNKCQETFSWGLRNPFRFAMDPNDAGTRFFINDVGQSAWEEIDLGTSGADFGWNCREGAHTNSTSGPCMPAPAGMVDPFFEYSRTGFVPGTSDTGCGSITGGAFAPDGVWPGYDGSYLFGDFNCGLLFKITQGGGGVWSGVRFASGTGGFTDMTFGPYGDGQALYYLTYSSGGQVHRVSYDTAGDAAPVAALSAGPISGTPPLTVNFDGSASTDPDAGDVLTYFWDFGDGGPVLETASAMTSHIYTSVGMYVATLKVRDDSYAFSAPRSVVIQPNAGPLDFNTVTPCRLVDTRTAGPSLAAGSTRTFTAGGACGIPATAKAVAVNVTVTGATSTGHVRLWPAGTPMTTASALNFTAGETKANNAIVSLGASGDFSVLAAFPSGTGDLVIDVVGWFE
jgi:glucose/arabinose dehydrogenase